MSQLAEKLKKGLQFIFKLMIKYEFCLTIIDIVKHNIYLLIKRMIKKDHEPCDSKHRNQNGNY